MSLAHRQRGVALIIALLAVALAVILIAALLDRGELAFARTRNVLRGAQAVAYADGLEAYAAQVLIKDLDERIDTRTDIWALPLPPQDVPGGRISASLRDLNGCFNLNNLIVADAALAGLWRERLRRLLTALELDPALAGAITDWVDGDGNVDTSGGAEDPAYLAQSVPYRAANRPFAHVSELRLVRGIDGAAYARLLPEVCALPPGTRLNLNTATTAVLMSLDSRITPALAGRVSLDGQARWSDVAAALREWEQQGIVIADLDRRGLGVASSYFLARADIVLDDVPFPASSLIERRAGGAAGGIRVLMRSRGADDDLGFANLLQHDGMR
ncbi:MAG TPA: type II secretion system minor pseudopilin GspK [Dokdonella sp.]|uniref:type II secretion system minor pseudopilin GspK n=1 Tax=Dokdonella sp. TaxID=2291710 RepID=UPI0025BECB8E|nr:type II secretion system minor pseudopilin GspK [Dokdonella sp.]MBX3690852.1 type II secretion system minor pseudopilin GspK [Dokdonella sp.]HNR91412.1 type II secretion system minor pseudopilin GspK [Dokdonella sp.]